MRVTLRLLIVAAGSVLIGFAAGYFAASVPTRDALHAPAYTNVRARTSARAPARTDMRAQEGPLTPPMVRTVKSPRRRSNVIRTSIDPKTGRTLYHTNTGKTYYLTPAGNRVYQKEYRYAS